ncbi:undecaprenyl-diphosphate phosphatase [Methylocella tundrae]|uniref:Undecaprenyl-diphosphatase n=1 Tax=Methylocella tundrae TaxID=227605 RepID=A0A4U8YXA1_METTU|nr:undecaprenyl-diphosphate phosphatase [Methylocella tundrae]WPP05017.1 undecaprenyl-diphosphate phosphatase [Methylocella tundrae]VFU07312.1 Undecaprenyl-diphosphatase 2 [Methylocella tundrae]
MASACTEGLDTGFVALGYAKVGVLGVVQGITELLPISSTAHMRIVPALLGWRDPGSAFSAAMQIAALAAVISYFWSDVRGLVFGSVEAALRRDFSDWNFRFAAWIILATIPIVIAGVLLAPILNACGSPLRSLTVIGLSCVVMAVLLALAELYSRPKRTVEHATLTDALVVGVAQVGALIPGVSRSGSTLTAALFRDFKRDEAARFSFLLGIPAIAAAGLHELWALHKAHLDAHGWSILAFGLVIASISAFGAIWGLLRILERFSAWPFVAYRALIGIFLLVAVFAGWLPN